MTHKTPDLGYLVFRPVVRTVLAQRWTPKRAKVNIIGILASMLVAEAGDDLNTELVYFEDEPLVRRAFAEFGILEDS